MYREFYGLREKPFSKTPDPRYLFLSRGHREALARLQYAVEERELALLTGDIGCGKTTISRALMDAMGEACRFCFIFNPRLSPLEFLRVIARSLGVDNPAGAKDELLKQLTETLYLMHAEGRCPVIVVDEAQLIPDRDVFDEIRLLTNYQLDDQNLMSVVLMGQPELRQILADPVHEPLRQRIALHYHLQPLSLDETLEYIDFRLEVAGGTPGLFSPDAVQRIHELSGGVPRKINILATNALLVGYGRDAAWIDASLVEELRDEANLY
ncbi:MULTISPECIES: ExeA family protein [Geobacter]|uniref:ExeA family protein n=1 Tax=Geobacter TaxID=28231 RepID=UPI0025727EDA|nr:AAA family ATPase [Geobacter sulfurreducens]BEH09795.1 AAA family ATPase [Geobacter sulfurreducens subsp. ethanolicus]BET57690.1 AAA family ATPase [Geobacter sp. 60473]